MVLAWISTGSQLSKESDLTRNIMAALRKMGAVVVKYHPMGGTIGTPDLIGCINGRAFVIEVKMPDQVPTKIQEHRLQEWHKAKAITGVAYSVDDAVKLISTYCI